jgi:hypothetical protein
MFLKYGLSVVSILAVLSMGIVDEENHTLRYSPRRKEFKVVNIRAGSREQLEARMKEIYSQNKADINNEIMTNKRQSETPTHLVENVNTPAVNYRYKKDQFRSRGHKYEGNPRGQNKYVMKKQEKIPESPLEINSLTGTETTPKEYAGREGDVVNRWNAENSGIPSIIHIFTQKCPPILPYERQWKRMGFETRCYSTKDQIKECRKVGIDIVKQKVTLIQVSDICRFAVLYTYGGLYSDADVEPNPNFRGQLGRMVDRRYGVIWGYEALFSSLQEKKRWPNMMDKSLCMWMVGAQPKSNYMIELARYLSGKIRSRKQGESLENYIHTTTGPTSVTKFMADKYKDLKVQGVNVFGCGQEHSYSSRCKGQYSFVKHHFKGTWRSSEKLDDILSAV